MLICHRMNDQLIRVRAVNLNITVYNHINIYYNYEVKKTKQIKYQ